MITICNQAEFHDRIHSVGPPRARLRSTPGEMQEGLMADIATAALEKTTMRKVFWRIIPYTFFLYVISYLDRANIGYAALQMNKELALTSEAFGFAAGIFFIGYFLFEVPSNVA